MDEHEWRDALRRHWSASDAGDVDGEDAIYAGDALVDDPQSRERIRGRHRIQASRMAQPDVKRFTLGRLLGSGGLWIGERVVAYDGRPIPVVSVMETGAKVVRETQYVAEPFDPGPARAAWAESMDDA